MTDDLVMKTGVHPAVVATMDAMDAIFEAMTTFAAPTLIESVTINLRTGEIITKHNAALGDTE